MSTEESLIARLEGRRNIYDENRIYGFEVFWRDHQPWLDERGYLLRPRYSPDWVPSWKGTNKDYTECEDGVGLRYDRIMDATRLSDGALVALKRVHKSEHPHEVEIATYLVSEPLASDTRNRTVPIYEILQLPNDEDEVLLVMPLLRRYDSPRFDTVGEVIAFLKQILEGLLFMHQNLVAHRDCNGYNIMLDPSRMYPQGFHPARPDRKRDFRRFAQYYTRSQRPPKYYYIDFGLSRRYRPEDMPPMEEIIRGGDKTAPEFENEDGRANPFYTDVYYLGNLMREDFIQDKYGFDFLQPLVQDMVQGDPCLRPTMEEVVPRFDDIVRGLSSWKLRSRVVKRDDYSIIGVFRTLSHWSRRIRFIIRRTPPIPLPDY
ncbi:hypothetical protein GLOTRDRAFT_115170 [Gloeophyllum trabeum ATCC 11539]|uniref:Protein kinase domain-containing protein n=1 Tax=Gloeophyllum trabeum (strain ATCC 11539 / FP-39264 / Madison 617) TaxID=670483 RepID=S7QB17_GLOTA|nr:uncharacterized protein GLOTRDRAFT_115170 [Gloeophyllum trabeum ATCC 11539]EPQ57121.1 hypothetical protein GLOTRDRAFT_115170 [Gloeophyllum trabeum ATCC 11539]